MSKVKAGGSSKNNHDSPGQRLGIKVAGGQNVKSGQIIVRQIGMTKRGGPGTYLSRNFSIHAKKDGIVQFKKRRVKTHSGRSVARTEVNVI